MTEVQYLGYIIDECGVHVDPTKIQVIRDWTAPTTLTELRSFLGLTNFYTQFRVGILSYHLALESSHQGRSESKIILVENSTEGACIIETSPLLCPGDYITKLATTI